MPLLKYLCGLVNFRHDILHPAFRENMRNIRVIILPILKLLTERISFVSQKTQATIVPAEPLASTHCCRCSCSFFVYSRGNLHSHRETPKLPESVSGRNYGTDLSTKITAPESKRLWTSYKKKKGKKSESYFFGLVVEVAIEEC